MQKTKPCFIIYEMINIFHSPIGLLQIQGDENYITHIQFVEQQIDEETSVWPLGEKAKGQLEEYFAGKRTTFDLPLQAQGTDFQHSVWKALQQIPFGKTCSYGEIALKIGNPKAARAIGNANNKNPIAIVVPCHRVIGANNELTGYAGGLWRKEFLLNLENKQ